MCYGARMKKPAKIIPLPQPDANQTAKSVLDQALAKVEKKRPPKKKGGKDN